MCRLAAFPPGFPAKEAHKIIKGFASWNKDGTGVSYVQNGELVQKRWPKSYEAIKKDKEDIFVHMPHKGWTIAHVRAATHGGRLIKNTHPFIKGDWSVVHNGIYSEYDFVGKLLTGLSGCKFEGDCDSEVAAELFRQLGPVKFCSTIRSHSGVFLGLNKDGSLAAVNTGGQLAMAETEWGLLLGSTLPFKYKGTIEIEKGWIKLDDKGKATTSKFRRWESYASRFTRLPGFGGGSRRGSAGCTRGAPAGEAGLGFSSEAFEDGDDEDDRDTRRSEPAGRGSGIVYLQNEDTGQIEEHDINPQGIGPGRIIGASSEEDGFMD